MKKILTVLLVLMVAVALVACTGDTTNASNPDLVESEASNASAPDLDEELDFGPASDADIEVPEEVKEEVALMTYAEYAAAELDTKVCVETYVQAHQSWWQDKVTVYCQSPDGACFLYELACSEEDAAKLLPGTKIRVTGTKGAWAGEVEIMNGTFEFVEGDDTFIAEALDVTHLLLAETEDEMLAHQNELVKFTAMEVENIEYKNGEPGDDIYVTLNRYGKSVSFCVEVYLTGTDSEVYQTVSALNVGDVVEVEAFLYWYEGANPHIVSITPVDAY